MQVITALLQVHTRYNKLLCPLFEGFKVRAPSCRIWLRGPVSVRAHTHTHTGGRKKHSNHLTSRQGRVPHFSQNGRSNTHSIKVRANIWERHTAHNEPFQAIGETRFLSLQRTLNRNDTWISWFNYTNQAADKLHSVPGINSKWLDGKGLNGAPVSYCSSDQAVALSVFGCCYLKIRDVRWWEKLFG